MTNEEVIREYRLAEREYKNAWQVAYGKRQETNHDIRLELALGEIDPQIKDRYYAAVTEMDVIKMKLEERLVQAYESMGFLKATQGMQQ